MDKFVHFRSKGRELSLQVLYQWDLIGDNFRSQVEGFIQRSGLTPRICTYAQEIVQQIIKDIKVIDAVIKQHATDWPLERMSVIDRNILRIGVVELEKPDIPPSVVINEAVELAKQFGGADSYRFINGILDKIFKTSDQTSSDAECENMTENGDPNGAG